VLKFAAGNDDQSHVTKPSAKKTAQRKEHLNKLLNRNKSELEPIQERVKEEDLG